MKKIHLKKFVSSIVLSFLAVIIIDILIQAIIFKQAWIEAKSFWLPPDEMNRLVPLGWLSLLIIIFLKGIVFTQFLEHNLKTGFKFGLLIGIASASGVFGLLTIVPWPKALVCGMALQQFLGDILMGLIFGKLYNPNSKPNTV